MRQLANQISGKNQVKLEKNLYPRKPSEHRLGYVIELEEEPCCPRLKLERELSM